MYDRNDIINGDQTDTLTTHHFSDHIYAKGMELPKGHVALSHRHSYSHLSCLAKGKCIVYTDNTKETYTAPAMIEIKAGVEHQIEALEDIMWYCIHATEETDPEKIDRVVIASE